MAKKFDVFRGMGLTADEIELITAIKIPKNKRQGIDSSITKDNRRLRLLAMFPHKKRIINYAFQENKKIRKIETVVYQRVLSGLKAHCAQNDIQIKSMCKGTLELLLGYSINDLINHLGFCEDSIQMEIDHLVPKSKFTFKSIYDEGFRKCWSLENLQLLSRSENRRKWNKAAMRGEK